MGVLYSLHSFWAPMKYEKIFFITNHFISINLIIWFEYEFDPWYAWFLYSVHLANSNGACKADSLNFPLLVFRLKFDFKSLICVKMVLVLTVYLIFPPRVGRLIHSVWRSDAFVHQTVWTGRISPSCCFKDNAAKLCLHSNESQTSTRLPVIQMSIVFSKTQPRDRSPAIIVSASTMCASLNLWWCSNWIKKSSMCLRIVMELIFLLTS